MEFPFETTMKDGRKATVLGMMPNGALIGYLTRKDNTFAPWYWNKDGSCMSEANSLNLPLQIKPLTAYRMRNGETAWTSGLIVDGFVYGITNDRTYRMWRVSDGRWTFQAADHPNDLIEEISSMENQK